MVIVEFSFRNPTRQIRGNSGPGGRLIAFGKCLFGHKQAIERSREPGVNRHLHDDLHHFLARASYVQGAVNMDLQLRGCIA